MKKVLLKNHLCINYCPPHNFETNCLNIIDLSDSQVCLADHKMNRYAKIHAMIAVRTICAIMDSGSEHTLDILKSSISLNERASSSYDFIVNCALQSYVELNVSLNGRLVISNVHIFLL